MDGESIWTSGMCPPCGRPSLIRASEISQLVNWDRLGGVYAVDMVRVTKYGTLYESSIKKELISSSFASTGIY